MRSRMDLGLINYINVDMKWTIMRKGRTSMTRCPRKPRADSFELGNKIHESVASERKKSGTDVAEKVVNAPLKKRRLLHQSASLPPQTLCINGEEGLSPGSQTASIHQEDAGLQHRSNSLLQSQKTKSKSRLRNSKILKRTNKEVLDLDDFSGIELLAAVACSSFIHDNAERVEDFSTPKELTTPPGIISCAVDIKDAESNSSSIQQNLECNGKEVEHKKVSPSKELRLHWDLNTVMDEWEEPCNDLLIEHQLPVKHDAVVSLAPPTENCNNDPVEEKYKLTEDLEAMSTKKINIKASDGESSASKSDVVDLLAHLGKCEGFFNSTTSVLTEQNAVNSESDRTDNSLVHSSSKITVSKSDQQPVSEEAMQDYCYNKITTDHVSECCGSNVTQEEQDHMAEGDSEDKLQAGYDSPFEDGELRELIGITEKESLYESDKIHKDDFGTIKNPLSEKVDHGQAMDQTSLLVKEVVPPDDEIKQGVQVDTFKRPHFDESRKKFCERKDRQDDELRPVGGNLLQNKESTSFDVFRNGEYGWRNRSSTTSGDLSIRVWDLKSHRSLDSNYSRNYNPRGISYRTHDRRPSSSERNSGYGSSRGPPPARSRSRDRYRFHSQEYHDPRPCHLERKPLLSTNFNRHGTRPRSRSRSGSPIAWHFQKRKNLDTSNSGEIETINRGGHVSPERSYKCFDERRFRDGQFRDTRQASVKQRFDPVGYPERLKSDDYFRSAQRPARFSQMSGYKYKG